VTAIVAIVAVGLNRPSTVGVRVGDQAPPLAGVTLDGRSMSLADLRGKPVIVNFWASWCVPCQAEFPLFRDAEARHPGLTILGVVFDDDPAAARRFADAQRADWPSLADPDRSRATAYTVLAPPQTYFIDRDGIVRSRQIGELTVADFERQYANIGG
jgi:cytochrome c biogenesis protein CcmG, thiol:disulfide interchange protein DsbE